MSKAEKTRFKGHTMINHLHIQNFKCLRDTTISFEPLTVLIGPNDSGKTSILELLHLVGQTTTTPLGEIFTGSRSIENVTWRRELGLAPAWELHGKAPLETGPVEFLLEVVMTEPPSWVATEKFEFKGLRVVREGNRLTIPAIQVQKENPGDETAIRFALGTHLKREFAPAAEAFASTGIYRLDPRALREPATPKVGEVLSPTGNNLAAVLDGLLSGPDRGAVHEMGDALRRAMPTLSGFATPPAPGRTGGEKMVNFVLAGNGKKPVTIPCDLASDGAMLLTAFLALAYSDTPEVLLIEEPENGLHPERLKEVIALLRQMTTGEVGNKKRQIILTTHSPLLLNYARPEEVRVVRRDPEQGTQVTPLEDVKGIDDLLEEFGVGELWYLLGEQALVEGKRP